MDNIIPLLLFEQCVNLYEPPGIHNVIQLCCFFVPASINSFKAIKNHSAIANRNHSARLVFIRSFRSGGLLCVYKSQNKFMKALTKPHLPIETALQANCLAQRLSRFANPSGTFL